MSLVRSNKMIERSPEPLERVKALVCEQCWTNCFDTEGFEKLGRREVKEFEYTFIKRKPSASNDKECSWCSFLCSRDEFQDFLCPFSEDPEVKRTVEFRLYDCVAFTPAGSNVYSLVVTWPGHADDLGPINMFACEDNIAGQQVTARKTRTTISPSSTREEILQWFNQCAGHRCCPKQTDSPLPTRLIDVKTLEIKTTRGRIGKYAALSYCWGSSSQVHLRSSTRKLDFDGLPQTIKDAIVVTRTLDIYYLWVDTLCIVQNDEADKAHEIGLMARTYSNAYVTIVASSAKRASEGFLEPRQPHDKGITLPFRVSPDRFGSVTAQTRHRPKALSEIGEPVDQRAWTLQEQLTARRLLLYSTHTLQWRCAAGTINLGQALHFETPQFPSANLLSQLSTDPEEAHIEWIRIVEIYSSRTASLERDKLPAIAAVAEKFAPLLGLYHAGIWTYGFLRQLGWRQWQYSASKLVSDCYRAPSWSWASIDGRVRFDYYRQHDQVACTLISANTLLKTNKIPYGEVIQGSITLRAKLLLGWISTIKQTVPSDSPCTLSSGLITFAIPDYHVRESPMTRFFKSYFQQSVSSSARIRNSKVPVSLDFDPRRNSRCDGLFYLLPLATSITVSRLRKYAHYKSSPADDIYLPMCCGLILLPAGPCTVKRVGYFDLLHECELEGIPEQEITIV